MSDPGMVPFIPENAPFTAEQRAYLNGFLAGLFSRTAAPSPLAAAPTPTLTPLTILFGSQTGNSENLAKRMAKEAGKRSFAPTVHDMAAYTAAQIETATNLLIVTSTYGDGEPPDSAKAFWEWLSSDAAPALAQTRFSVCALGDTNYAQFCAFGKSVDTRLQALGATCVAPRQDCDVDYEAAFTQWLDRALAAFGPATASSSTDASTPSASALATVSTATPDPVAGYNRQRPFPSRLLKNFKLNSAGSTKDTRHFSFSLEGSGLTYEAGDALGVAPKNCPALVEEILQALKASGNEPVPSKAGTEIPLRHALLEHYEITRINMPFLKALAERTGDPTLLRFSGPNQNGELTQFLRGRELIDLLLGHPHNPFSATELVSYLKPLQPRLYSISSSPKAHADEVHLTVAVVRYDALGRPRKGVCSTFLAERAEESGAIPIYIHPNKNFRPPAEDDRKVIMVGPGTGIAPFRAFLQERRARGARGKNWLFFGDQHADTDFLYRSELEVMLRDGTLSRCDTAFSRDQAERIYVQHRMLEQAGELYAWLEEGACFYVCGDASRMAKDVDRALHQVIEVAGGKTAEQAVEYVKALQGQKRYQRDVY